MIKKNRLIGILSILAILLLASCAQQPVTKPIDPAILYQNERAALAQNALAQHQPRQTLKILNHIPAVSMPANILSNHYRLRADAYAMIGNHIESARELIWREQYLTEDGINNNHLAIWEQLSLLSNEALAYLRTATAPDILSGWMELLYITRSYQQDEKQLKVRIQEWLQRYSQHPATIDMLPQFTEQSQRRNSLQKRIKRIALLLPLEGKLATNASNIRDGLMAALLQYPAEKRPELRIYDSSGDSSLITDIYQMATADGADFVIGPLRKEAVEELSRQTNLPVPVLALNQINSESTPDNFYQFALSPEDEAWQVAERARLAGHQQALALLPQGNWGDRVLQAFSEHWLDIGGNMLEVQRYDRSKVDFSDPIQALLDLDQSKKRYRQLKRITGKAIQFEPRRRQDADFVFLLSTPNTARLLRPQFRFHRASSLPIYATSHIYTGYPNPKLDQDLNGIRFCDIPWTLPQQFTSPLTQQMERWWSQDMQHYRRLIALGIDSYGILPYLKELGSGAYHRYDGMTGVLQLDEQRRIHRNLVWAQFKKGKPALLPDISVDIPEQSRDII
ncbi:MAG: penicillin-binding protein activator [Gammaproteobacteria bacterium]|nr:penicillin-binding protein activator [Gammaproteobacteria bacterium]